MVSLKTFAKLNVDDQVIELYLDGYLKHTVPIKAIKNNLEICLNDFTIICNESDNTIAVQRPLFPKCVLSKKQPLAQFDYRTLQEFLKDLLMFFLIIFIGNITSLLWYDHKTIILDLVVINFVCVNVICGYFHLVYKKIKLK